MPKDKKNPTASHSVNMSYTQLSNLAQQQVNSNTYQKSSTDLVSQYLKDTQQRILLDIQDDKLQIPKQKKQLLNEDEKERLLRQKKELEMKQVKKQKQQAKLHFIQLGEQQKSLRQQKYRRMKSYLKNSNGNILNESSVSKSRLASSKLSKSFNSVQANQQTQQISKKMKKLRKQREQFERRCANRTHIRQQELQQLEKQVKSLKQEMIVTLKENSRKKAEQRLNELEKRKIQRAKQQQFSKKRIQQLKNRWNLHDGMEKYWELTRKKENQLKIEQSRAIYKQLNWNAQQIRQHSKKYDQILEKQRASRKNKMLQLSRIAESTPVSYHSAFYEQIISQQKINRQKTNPKMVALQIRKKIRAFDDYVRNEKKPTIKPEQVFIPPKEQPKGKKGLQHYQTVKLGNQYLKLGNKNIKAKTETQADDISKYENKQNVQPIKKINYLPDLKAKRKEILEKDPNFQEKIKQKYWRQIEKAKQIVNSNLSHTEKVQQIRQLTNQIESGQMLPNSKLIDKVTAKLKILAMIQE